jgi:diketogulonate reductase-like aldo/keto reductase
MKESFQQAIRYAIVEEGYRLIDTASIYDNEHFIGQTLQELFSEGIVKQEDLFIVTKLSWKEVFKVEEALQESLEKLQ